MKKYDITICIPSRNEMFLRNTIDDIQKNIRGNTEIIVGLDGAWSDPPLEDAPNLTIIHYPESIGQRQITNKCVKLSNGKYVIKTDGHCAFSEGFDVEMLKTFEKLGDNIVAVPVMRNLWAFDWVCKKCGYRRYQGPTPVDCPKCDNKTDFERDIKWIAKDSPKSVSYCFDSEPHFQYFKEYAKRPEYQKDLKETGFSRTMSLQGSFFMCSREKYWELNLGNEDFGSWGSQAIQVACSFWLTGGEVIVNHNCWYSHLFRTQGGDFSFPYKQHQSQINHAKKFARDLFFNNRFPHQTRPLSWLLEKFAPINGWTEADIAEQKERERHHPKFGVNATTQAPKKVDTTTIEPLKDLKDIKQSLEAQNGLETNISYAKIASNEPTKGILFYTDNQLQLKLAHAVQKRLRNISKELNIPITSVSLKPMDKMGYNIHLNLERGKITYYKQILAGLEASNAKIIYFTEHDCLYHKSNFIFTPKKKDMFYYNVNWYKIRLTDGFAVGWEAPQVSGLCGYRQHLLDFYRKRLKEIKQDESSNSYEPGGRDKNLFQVWKSEIAYLDIRHSGTMTGDKWSIDDFRDKSTCINWKECNVKDIKGWEGLII